MVRVWFCHRHTVQQGIALAQLAAVFLSGKGQGSPAMLIPISTQDEWFTSSLSQVGALTKTHWMQLCPTHLQSDSKIWAFKINANTQITIATLTAHTVLCTTKWRLNGPWSQGKGIQFPKLLLHQSQARHVGSSNLPGCNRLPESTGDWVKGTKACWKKLLHSYRGKNKNKKEVRAKLSNRESI